MSSEPGLFVPPRVDAMLGSHRKIEAIKAVLDANPGASLRAAKAAVDARIAALTETFPACPRRRSKRCCAVR